MQGVFLACYTWYKLKNAFCNVFFSIISKMLIMLHVLQPKTAKVKQKMKESCF